MIKLLIVDNSALMRKLLEEIFREEGDFDLRVARNGTEALELVRSFDPQVVTLDVQMPAMDGLACLSQIMIEAPRAVVMISALTEEGAEATLEAIELGAVDFVTKPSGTVSLEIERLRPILVAKVRGATQARIRRTLRLTERIRHQFRGAGVLPRAARPARPVKARATSDRPQEGLVLIGTSTGGPAALDVVLPQLPQGLPWPVVVAQHMPASPARSPSASTGYALSTSSRSIARCRCRQALFTSAAAMQTWWWQDAQPESTRCLSRRSAPIHGIRASSG